MEKRQEIRKKLDVVQKTNIEVIDAVAEEAINEKVAVEAAVVNVGLNSKSLWAEKEAITENGTEQVVVRGNESLENYDTFIYTYRDNVKCGIAEEAVDFFEDCLTKNFEENKVKNQDRVYQIFSPKHVEDNDIEVRLNLKKNNWLVERSARKIQTGNVDAPVYVSLKDIVR